MSETEIDRSKLETPQESEKPTAESGPMTMAELEAYRQESGLHKSIELPRPGTPAFERLLAAEEFTRFAVGPSPQKATTRPESVAMYEDRRRERHKELSIMLLGRPFEDLSDVERRAVSNFAALLAGHRELVGTF